MYHISNKYVKSLALTELFLEMDCCASFSNKRNFIQEILSS